MTRLSLIVLDLILTGLHDSSTKPFTYIYAVYVYVYICYYWFSIFMVGKRCYINGKAHEHADTSHTKEATEWWYCICYYYGEGGYVLFILLYLIIIRDLMMPYIVDLFFGPLSLFLCLCLFSSIYWFFVFISRFLELQFFFVYDSFMIFAIE